MPEGGILNYLLNNTASALRCTNDSKVFGTPCDSNVSPCLFDLAADPCEYNNVAQEHPDIVESMLERLLSFNATESVFPPEVPTSRDPQAQAQFHDGLVGPWIDDEYN